MKSQRFFVGVIFVAITMVISLCFGGAREARAQGEFSGFAFHDVGSDFVSGFAGGVTNGTNAVITGITGQVYYYLNPEAETAHIYTSFTFKGVWGDPTAENPYYDFLENRGLYSDTSFQTTEVYWNGEWWEFAEEVGVWNSGHARLDRNPAHTKMNGQFGSFASSRNAIPTASDVRIYEYEPGHPEWLPDWEVNISSSWFVTTEFRRMVPTPGTAGLVCTAGLLMFRRRR